jgi:hypothetical protein
MDYGDDRVSVISMSYFQFTNCLETVTPFESGYPLLSLALTVDAMPVQRVFEDL